MDIYLIRHTRPALAPGVCYGQLDVGLPADFLEQAAAVQARAALPADAPIVTPKAERCRRLADHLAAARGARVTVDDRLRDLDFGEWEGQRWDEIPRVQTTVWSRDIWNQTAPGGESYAALHERVRAVWESLTGGEEAALSIVAPAGPLRALMTVALELPADAFVRLHLDYGGIAKLADASGGWRLEYSNR
jgi:alpha-ribazole phosphatase